MENNNAANRPFLSYNNFRKISLEKLEYENGQNENYKFCTENASSPFQKGQHSICRVIRRFPDGRCWIEMGGHELLLLGPNNGEINANGDEEEECAQNSPGPNNHFFCVNSHLKNCIFANNSPTSTTMASFNQRNQSTIGIGGYPERLPFPAFCRAFRSILHPIGQKSAEFEDSREIARSILEGAQIAEHRFRLGLSQILLQREVLDELIAKRNLAILPTIIAFQANCRRYLAVKKFKKWQKKEEAILCIQRNLEGWQSLKSSQWWKLFTQIRPLIPIISSDEKERLWREQTAQLELELDEMRSEMSRAQLELESIKKAKEMADKWGQELSDKNREIQTELENLRGQKLAIKEKAAIMKSNEQNEEQTSNADWETDEKTMDLKRQLADAIDREYFAQEKAQRAMEQLKDMEAEMEDLRGKNERIERRLKSTNVDLSRVREQLDRVMEQKEQLKRKQLEANLKESRKRSEIQRENGAKQNELEQIRMQNERRIRQLESQLEEAIAENMALVKQRNSAEKKMGGSQIGSMAGSMLDLAQNSSSLMSANRALKRKLAKALALIQSTQQLTRNRENTFDRQTQLRALRQQIEEAETEKLAAFRAQLVAENEYAQIRAELDSALSTKLAAEQKLVLAIREKNAATALAQEYDGQLQKALKREKSLAEFAGMDQIQMRTQLEQIAQLERELRELKTELTKTSVETEFTSQNYVERQRLEMTELRLRDCQAKLELEQAQRQRIEVILSKLKDDLDSVQQQLAEERVAKEREMEGKRRLRKEMLALQEQMNEEKRRETELQSAQRQLKMDCLKLEEEKRIYAADLKMMNKRMEILQNAFNADCLGGEGGGGSGGGSIGVGRTFSSICGGSELGDLEEGMILEGGEANDEETENGTTDSLENFDGANSDTVEGSSSGGGEK